jgi:5-formyltetrahydrofolate cyclo-ligase
LVRQTISGTDSGTATHRSFVRRRVHAIHARTIAEIPKNTVHANRYGIPEPELPEAALIEPDAMDVVLVPLLAFDRHGMRLGTGGGYYDRSFAFLQQRERPTRPLLIGIGYAFQEVEMLVAEAWDVRLDFVATEAELIQCTTTSS